MSAVSVTGGTKIEWADFTFNPWWGCEKVSPGCAHCYADTLAQRHQPGVQLWGAGHSFRLFGDGHWAEPLKWARTAPAKLGRRPRVFCASMADVFEERPELERHRVRLWQLIWETPELDWLVLTKRPEFARDWLRATVLPLRNLWMGVSIENARFTWRADVLRDIPAAVRFISAEPLLGSLFQDARDPKPLELTVEERRHVRAPLNLDGIDWVIVGGESGSKARPMQIEWARELVVRCRDFGDGLDDYVSPFVKQLGRRPTADGQPLGLRDAKGGNWDEWPHDLRVREFPRTAGGARG